MDPKIERALNSIWDGTPAADLKSQALDFKTTGRSLRDTLKNLAEAAACFANAQGGTLVVGVEDKAWGADAFVGSTLDPIRTVSRIYELTEPGLIVITDQLFFRGTELTLITVPRSPDVHQIGGRATERIGTSCRPMTAARITTVLSDRRGDDWSAGDSGKATDSASPIAQALARDLLAQVPDPERNSWSRLSWADMCSRLGMVTDGRLTNGRALRSTWNRPRHLAFCRISLVGGCW